MPDSSAGPDTPVEPKSTLDAVDQPKLEAVSLGSAPVWRGVGNVFRFQSNDTPEALAFFGWQPGVWLSVAEHAALVAVAEMFPVFIDEAADTAGWGGVTPGARHAYREFMLLVKDARAIADHLDATRASRDTDGAT